MTRHRVLALAVALACSSVVSMGPAAARTNLSTNTDASSGEALLAVVQQDLHRVDVVSAERNGFPVVRRLGRRGHGQGELILPGGAAVGSGGVVWVSDSGNNRLQRFDRDGRVDLVVRDLAAHGALDLEILDTWGGSHGSGPGAFYNPQGVAVDARGRVWVVDYGNHRGQVFTTTGEFLSTFLDGQVGMIEAKEVHTSAGRLPPYAVLLGGAVMIFVEIARRARGRRSVLEPL